MNTRTFHWDDDAGRHELALVHVPGTQGTPFLFGHGDARRPIEVGGFFLGTTPVTQALWQRVMGANPASRKDPRCPVENVSWIQVAGPGGFLDRINASDILPAVAHGDADLRFRLPSETEWEYAARGGPHWRDEFAYSGGDDPRAVAWFGPRWTRGHRLLARVVGWRAAWRLAHVFGPPARLRTRTHPVAAKVPNQLGLYDMSGNVWEWCADACADLESVPADGRPFAGGGGERRLRGGCHHNWDLHCTVWWRYGMEPEAHDGCTGFRLALGKIGAAATDARARPARSDATAQ